MGSCETARFAMASRTVTVHLTDWYNHSLCASCEKPDNRKGRYRKNTQYCRYTSNADTRFKSASIRFCVDCWSSNCELCKDCLIPTEVAFSNKLGGLVLLQTSIVQEAPNQDHLCVHCLADRKQVIANISKHKDERYSAFCPRCGVHGDREDDPNTPELLRLACSTPPTLPPSFVEHYKCPESRDCPRWTVKGGIRGPPDDQSSTPAECIKKRDRWSFPPAQ